ncbi:aspartate/glutamate racemase family protein [Roseibium sp. MMSF_3412]|uniref:aspartate/glutamate racemase family protein n=1 Tax=Roseibium sp. MMSF_3412 TaxID=3046712 RepID=UPI00273E96BE|nr:aspartate/glutamate racemase family protein [Roseibium sp. MMSF_3412]
MTPEDRHLLIINPNTTVAMTEKIGEAARAAAGPGTRITAINPVHGPAAIQGADDGAAALPGLYSLVEDVVESGERYDALIIACFDDTGLWTLKEKLKIPVIGIGEAAYHAAALLASRFSVVTTLSVSVPVLEENLDRNGLKRRCGKVRASEVPVLELEEASPGAINKIRAEIEAALLEDQAGAIALGCAGMADLAHALSAEFGIPVIDGVAAAVRLADVVLDTGGRDRFASGTPGARLDAVP